MKVAEKQKLLDKVKQFNKKYKVGDIVQVKKDLTKGADCFISQITYKSYVLGRHTAVVYLKDKGVYDIDCIVKKLKPTDATITNGSGETKRGAKINRRA